MGHCRIAWYSATNPWNSCCVQPCLRRQRALRWGAAYDRHLCCNLPANSDIDIDLLRWIKTYGITLCNMHQRVIMQLSVCMNVFLMNVALCMHGCMHGCVDVGINMYIYIYLSFQIVLHKRWLHIWCHHQYHPVLDLVYTQRITVIICLNNWAVWPRYPGLPSIVPLVENFHRKPLIAILYLPWDCNSVLAGSKDQFHHGIGLESFIERPGEKKTSNSWMNRIMCYYRSCIKRPLVMLLNDIFHILLGMRNLNWALNLAETSKDIGNRCV